MCLKLCTVCIYSVFVVRKKRGSTKFSSTNEPVDTEPPAAHEYISLETNLTIKSNDDGRDNEGQSEVEENEEEEEDMEQKYGNMTNEEEEEGMEQQYENMKESIQDNNKEGETREMEIKLEMREEAIANENPIVAVYAIISKKN